MIIKPYHIVILWIGCIIFNAVFLQVSTGHLILPNNSCPYGGTCMLGDCGCINYDITVLTVIMYVLGAPLITIIFLFGILSDLVITILSFKLYGG